MERSLLFVLLITFSLGVFGQTEPLANKPNTRIQLKDGSIFRGEKIDETGYHIEMIIATGDTVIFDKNNVVGITDLDFTNTILFKTNRYHKKEGIFVHVSYGLRSYNAEVTNKGDMTFGKRLSEKMQLGFGLGITQSDALITQNTWVFTTFVNPYIYGRRYINQNNFRPFVDAKMGYGFSTRERNHSGGVYLEPGIGIQAASRGKFKWNMGLSFYYQATEGQRTEGGVGPFNMPIEIDYRIKYSRLLLNFGVEI